MAGSVWAWQPEWITFETVFHLINTVCELINTVYHLRVYQVKNRDYQQLLCNKAIYTVIFYKHCLSTDNQRLSVINVGVGVGVSQ